MLAAQHRVDIEAAYRDACNAWSAAERPSIHQVRRFLDKLGTVTRERGRMGPRELKNIQPFIRRDFSHLEPNDIWTADGHCYDAEVQHPLHGRPFRPEITAILDIAQPGDRILLASFGSGAGSDAFDLTVTDKITERRDKALKTQDYIARRTEIDYATYARMRGKITMK